MTPTPETPRELEARLFDFEQDFRGRLFALAEEYDNLRKRLEAAEKWRRVAEILRSVVKSGEPWTPTLEAEWDAALAREKK